MTLPFLKMHGLGNDFVVIDARKDHVAIGGDQARLVADRRRGVGCDQVIVVEPPRNGSAGAFMRILNADGGEVEACGNATRCVARLLFEEGAPDGVAIETVAGPLHCSRATDGLVSVDMGAPRLSWRDIPVAHECDTLHLPVAISQLKDPVGTSMGNPHATFFVADVEAVPVSIFGPEIEHHPFFPERVNVGVATVLSREHLRLRVWERGVGLTLACGTGACAAAVAAVRRGLTGRSMVLTLDGGDLDVEWRESDGHVIMTGPTALSFKGELGDALGLGAGG